MKANKLENFEVGIVKRSQVNLAPYNPRRITETNKKKLKAFLAKNGLWQSLVWNKQTGNLVSGHQRIQIMDTLLDYPKKDYELTMSIVDVPEDLEKKGNVFMNNSSAMGEFDNDMLQEIFAGLDGGVNNVANMQEMGFDRLDLESIFAGQSDFLQSVFKPQSAAQEEMTQEAIEQKEATYQAARAEERAMRKADVGRNASGDDYQSKYDDYLITFVCDTNAQKQEVMERMGYPASEKFAKVGKLFDIQDGKIRVYGLVKPV